MDINFQLGDGKYYVMGCGKILFKDMPAGLNEMSIALMAGVTPISDDQMNTLRTYFHDGNPPGTFMNDISGGLSGIIFIGGIDVPIPILPELDWNLPVVTVTLEHGIFLNAYLKISLDPKELQFAVGGVAGVWVHVGVGVSAIVACVMVDLKATASADVTGSISRDNSKTDIHIGCQLVLEGSAHAGVGICNSDCETPCTHIPIVGNVCSPIPCEDVKLSKTLKAQLGVTISGSGTKLDKPLSFN